MGLPNIIGAARSLAGAAAGSLIGGGGAAKNENGLYKINEFNWYQSLPYGFAFFDIKSSTTNGDTTKATSTIYLPIAPNNVNVVTHFATNIVTTLYGIVEEHSEVRYYDITISGTTGIAPRYTQPFSGFSSIAAKSPGRQDFESPLTPPLLGAIGSLSAIATMSNPLTGAINMAPDLIGANDANNRNHSGVGTKQTGYYAFHQLYQFFLKYKNDASQLGAPLEETPPLIELAKKAASAFGLGKVAGVTSSAAPLERKVHPIQFLNYKDGNKYDCIPIAFTLTRSADNPMLYNYNIRLKAFNLRSVTNVPVGTSQLSKMGISNGLETDTLFQAFGNATGGLSAVTSSLV